MTSTESDPVALSETVPSGPSEFSQAQVKSELPIEQAATNTCDDDDDLEEGELKDDDDDSDDDELDAIGEPVTTQQTRLLPPINTGAHYNVMKPNLDSSSGLPTGPDNEQLPKKRRKKRVVRKVKKMVKVIKKVPKKKLDHHHQKQQPQQQPSQSKQEQQPLLSQQPMLPQNKTPQPHQQQQQPTQQQFDNQRSGDNQRLLPHISNSTSTNSSSNNTSNDIKLATKLDPTPPLQVPSNQSTGNNLDSLLQQQILMLQELQRQQQPQQQQQPQSHITNQHDQQHAQILRAAATDEDLRYMQPPYLFNGQNMNLIQQDHPIQPFISQNNPIAMNQPTPFTTSMQNINTLAPPGMMTSANLMNPLGSNSLLRPNQPTGMLSQNDGLTPMMQQQLQSISQPTQTMFNQHQQQPAPLLPQAQPQSQHQQYQHQPMPQLISQTQQQQQPDNTPSSPDDENGKSSYEAISKMLTLLRNSANVSDSSETSNQNRDNQIGDSFTEPNKTKSRANFEYSLIPVLVQGIDYTKYKLLSQYEPKFKNDPRLNQQA